MKQINFCQKRQMSSRLNSIFGDDLVNFVHESKPYVVRNFIDGKWSSDELECHNSHLLNPLTGQKSFSVSHLNIYKIEEIKESLKKCPKSGLFNPLKKPFMYRKWGEILFKTASKLHEPEVEEFFKLLMGLCIPKSAIETHKEFLVSRQGIENFCGDNPRFALKGFVVPGDREGQESVGYRFPFGPTALITPFNFPLEIPTLQLIGACITGNKTLIKPDIRGAPVVEALVRLLEHSGMPSDSVILANADRDDSAKLFEKCKDVIRLVQFTGSSNVAEKLLQQFHGKVKIEDSGFNWKILGPDVQQVDFVVSQIDQDSFATSGQKCSCQRLLLMHSNWKQAGVLEKLAIRTAGRKLSDLTISPIMSVTNQDIETRIKDLLTLSGSQIIVGGKKVASENCVPINYGLFEPTIIQIPFEHFKRIENHDLLFKELFGPLLIVTEYNDTNLDDVVQITEAIKFHLTAAIVSNDPKFVNYFAKQTVNGVTYVGIKGRTTGAPQNHFFGPSNDPRGAGIGTVEAIVNTWTCHREVIYDFGTLNEKEESALKQS